MAALTSQGNKFRTLLFIAVGFLSVGWERSLIGVITVEPTDKASLAVCRRGLWVNAMENDALASFMCQNR